MTKKKLDVPDYSAYATTGHNRPPGDVEELLKLANEQIQCELRVEKAEAELDEAKKALKKISEEILPDKMDELGIPLFKNKEGVQIEIKDKVEAHVSEERKLEANKWLDDNGYGGLLKSEVKIPYRRSELEAAKKLVLELNARGLIAKLDRSVHHQTLLAFIREQLAEGKDLPIELFGVRRTRVSKIKVKEKPDN